MLSTYEYIFIYKLKRSCIWLPAITPSRLKILLALSGGELCVEHITEAVGGNQSAVSHQLKILKDNKIVKGRRDGKNVLYSVSDWHVLTMIGVAKEHLDCNE